MALVTPSPSAITDQSMNATAGARFSTPVASPMDKLHCPMNDRELLTYFEPLSQDLNEGFGIPGDGGNAGNGQVQMEQRTIPVYHDLWATMTMNWSDD